GDGGAGGGGGAGGAGGATAKKSAAKKSTTKRGAGVTAANTGGTGVAGGSRDLRGELRDFARSRPGGWGHDEWQGLLGDLRGRGHDVSDEGAVGMQLERERLAHQLEDVGGLGKKADALVDRFETVYSLRQASVDDIASVKGIDRQLAERVKERFS
ncbi:MAG TPA: helix-hairpin-helix domain-containing protein, partial [Longimicrobiaceae bacterium]|nr:helix-hairpin-helix domain-containing protein [Longimicrobiaceae bacterium]